MTTAASTFKWAAALAALTVALALPNRLDQLTAAALLRVPVELPLLALFLVTMPHRLHRAVRAVAVVILTPVLVVKLADLAVFAAFARPFSPLVDTLMAPIAVETLAQTSGPWAAGAAVLAVAALVGLIAAGLNWSVRAVQHAAPRAGLAWGAAATAAVAALTPLGTARQSDAVREHATALAQGLRAAATFRADLAALELDAGLTHGALTGLAGSDVLVIFVESYGRTSLDHPDYAPMLRARLAAFDAALADAGFAARSAWLTSPTYGGESYLAHSSFLSGLWIDDRQRYAHLLRSEARTLMHDFNQSGWRTVAVMPLITRPWPDADWFGYDIVYDAARLGYAGPSFGYVTMPDQFALSVFQRQELAPTDRKPVMAEIALIASHIPWTPLPAFVPWDQLGDGAVFATARTQESSDAIWRDPRQLRQSYAKSLDYVLETLMSFVATYGRDDMLFIIVGDHQPMAFMADSTAREVPVHVIARDPAVVAALGAGWTDGMQPDDASPIHPMHTMRARILHAFAD
ncbi:MAG: hypothetical protein SFV21_04680 [Rhodospirillaceae bacterium]|nr:hypothetical protein [Rhodospirillaceae bacterium]